MSDQGAVALVGEEAAMPGVCDPEGQGAAGREAGGGVVVLGVRGVEVCGGVMVAVRGGVGLLVRGGVMLVVEMGGVE